MMRFVAATAALLGVASCLPAGPEDAWKERLTSKGLWTADVGGDRMVIVSFDKPAKDGSARVYLDVVTIHRAGDKAVPFFRSYVGDYAVVGDGDRAVVICRFRTRYEKVGDRPKAEDRGFTPATVTLILESKERTYKAIGEKDGKFVPVDRTYRSLGMHFTSDDVGALGWWRSGPSGAVEMIE